MHFYCLLLKSSNSKGPQYNKNNNNSQWWGWWWLCTNYDRRWFNIILVFSSCVRLAAQCQLMLGKYYGRGNMFREIYWFLSIQFDFYSSRVRYSSRGKRKNAQSHTRRRHDTIDRMHQVEMGNASFPNRFIPIPESRLRLFLGSLINSKLLGCSNSSWRLFCVRRSNKYWTTCESQCVHVNERRRKITINCVDVPYNWRIEVIRFHAIAHIHS